MVSAEQGIQSKFGPSNRILELAQHKTSKTVWATTPCEKLRWGNQEPIWPLSASALGVAPSSRIQHLSRHKRDFSAWEEPRRKEEEEEAEEEEEEQAVNFSRKNRRPSSKASQYDHIVRLSTPRARSLSAQEAGSNRPVRSVDPSSRASVITPRLLQLSNHKLNHPDFQSNRQSVASIVSFASKSAGVSERLVQLSLPRLKQSDVCLELGRPAESIWTVSKAARRATASARLQMLATPKQLSKDYIPPREPERSRKNILHTREEF